jgi:flagellar hook-basal body complex protein FliE
MVDRIGQGGGLAREAILAALRSQAETARASSGALERAQEASGTSRGATQQVDFARELGAGLRAVEAQLERVDQLPLDVLSGRVDDFHEIAVQIKNADVSFRFAMEIRNKLIDAYREVMRMNV